MLKSIYLYRSFIQSSIKNEFMARFSRSKLGALWMIINPLVQVAIYALILSNVLAAKLPGIDNKYSYAIYLVAGTIGWSLFAEIVSRCLTIFIDQGNLMKKMRFPKITLPVIVAGSCLLNNVLLIVSAFVVFSFLSHEVGLVALWLIPLTLAVIALGLGIGLTLGVLNVFVRDIGQVVPILLQLLFWFTPVVYPASVIPAWLQHYISWNPMLPIIDAYHQILVYGVSPETGHVFQVISIAVVLSFFGLFIFRRASPEMADVL